MVEPVSQPIRPPSADDGARDVGQGEKPTAAPVERMLNVFALPAETEVRFFLLAAAAFVLTCICFGVFASVATWALRPPPPRTMLATLLRMAEARERSEREGLGVALAHALRRHAAHAAAKLALLGALLALWYLLARRIYRGHPERLRRRRRLVPLDAARDARLLATVERIHASIPADHPWRARLGRGVPRLETEPGGMGRVPAEARAFGMEHAPAIALTGGARLELRREPALFAVRILHELAHFANRDVRSEQVTKALWYALLFTGIVPLVGGLACLLVLLGPGNPAVPMFGMTATTAVQAAAAFAVAGMAWVGLLRERELYADWRAALWDAEARTWLLACWQRESARARGWLRLSFHPRPRDRHAVLAEPALLFRPRPAASLFTGVLAGFITHVAFNFASLPGDIVLPLLGSAYLSLWLHVHPAWLHALQPQLVLVTISAFGLSVAAVLGGFLPGAGLVAWALGTQVQRAAVARCARPSTARARSAGHAVSALSAATGFELGLQISPGLGASYAPQGPLHFGLAAAHFACLAGALWLWMRCAHQASSLLLGAHTGARPPRRQLRVLNLSGTLLLLAVWVPLAILRTAGANLDEVARLPRNILVADVRIACALAVAAIGVHLVAAAALWMWSRLRKPPACPACRMTQSDGTSVGRTCRACGAMLDEWLWLSAATVRA